MGMRAFTLIAGFVAALAAERSAAAQERGGFDGVIDRLGAGFYGGISISTFSGNDLDGSSMFSNTAKAAPTFAGLITLALNDRFALQGEAALATKGASFTDIDGVEGTINLYCVEFPVLIKFERAF